MDGLEKRKGYKEFEKENELLLAIIDIGTRETSSRFVNLIGEI